MTTAELASSILDGAVGDHVVLGPIVWQPSDGKTGKRWYFTVAVCGPDGCCLDTIDAGGDEQLTVQMRMALKSAFYAHRPIVVHDTHDELYMTKLCETLWPGDRITQIRENVERERVVWAAERRERSNREGANK